MADQAALALLTTIEEGECVAQRGLGQRVGIALGLTHRLLKRASFKELVKARRVSAKRFA